MVMPVPSSQNDVFKIRFTGRRFQNHSLPLELIGDLELINDMILDAASEIYKDKTGAKRVPVGFRDRYGLSLCSISQGSTVSEIRYLPSTGQMRIIDSNEDSSLSEAIADCISYINCGQSAHRAVFAPRVKTLGSKLKDDESMEMSFRGETAVYNQLRRRSLIGPEEDIEVHDTLYGRITEVDLTKRTFKMSPVPEDGTRRMDLSMDELQTIDSTTHIPLKDLIGQRIAVTGTFLEKKDGTRSKKDIETLDLLEPLNVVYRLLELSALKYGWGEYGDETAPDRERILELIDLYVSYGTGLKDPYIYPMNDGRIQFEWDARELLEMDIDLQTMSGVLYCGDDTVELDLNTSYGWELLISKVDSYAGQRHPPPSHCESEDGAGRPHNIDGLHTIPR